MGKIDSQRSLCIGRSSNLLIVVVVVVLFVSFSGFSSSASSSSVQNQAPPILSPFFYLCSYHGNQDQSNIGVGEVALSVFVDGNPNTYVPGREYRGWLVGWLVAAWCVIRIPGDYQIPPNAVK